MDRVAIDFSIFNIRIQIYWYSVFILLGILVGITYIFREARRKGFNEDLFSDMILNTIFIGIIGARLYYVLFNFGYYYYNPIEILEIWNGGLAIHGGILAGALYLWYFAKTRKMDYLINLDIAAVALIIAQSVGRWGNFFNKEAYGPVISKESLGIFPEFIQEGMKVQGLYRAPMFFYESIWNFIGFIIMLFLRKRPHIKKGYLLSFYLMWYSLGRFFIEGYRTDSLMLGNFRVAQIISVVLFIIGILLILFQSRSGKLEKLYNSRDTVVKNVKGE